MLAEVEETQSDSASDSQRCWNLPLAQRRQTLAPVFDVDQVLERKAPVLSVDQVLERKGPVFSVHQVLERKNPCCLSSCRRSSLQAQV